jgi:flagellar FliJ protein
MSSTSTTTTDWTRLRELAVQRRDAWATRLAQASRQAAEGRHKLDLLREYRREYLARMGSAGRSGIHGDGLRNYRTFLANLDRAIEQQGEAVLSVERERTRAQDAWTAEQRAVHSYEVLQARQTSSAARRERREHQKQQDEFAIRTLPRFLSGAD